MQSYRMSLIFACTYFFPATILVGLIWFHDIEKQNNINLNNQQKFYIRKDILKIFINLMNQICLKIMNNCYPDIYLVKDVSHMLLKIIYYMLLKKTTDFLKYNFDAHISS